MVAAVDLGSIVEKRAGSSPVSPTTISRYLLCKSC